MFESETEGEWECAGDLRECSPVEIGGEDREVERNVGQANNSCTSGRYDTSMKAACQPSRCRSSSEALLVWRHLTASESIEVGPQHAEDVL